MHLSRPTCLSDYQCEAVGVIEMQPQVEYSHSKSFYPAPFVHSRHRPAPSRMGEKLVSFQIPHGDRRNKRCPPAVNTTSKVTCLTDSVFFCGHVDVLHTFNGESDCQCGICTSATNKGTERSCETNKKKNVQAETTAERQLIFGSIHNK